MKRIKSKKHFGGLIAILFFIMVSLSITAFVLEVMQNKDCPSSENYSDEDSGCVKCGENTYNDGTSLTCIPCPSGETAAPGSSKCSTCDTCGGDCKKQDCQDGYTCGGGSGNYACKACEDGQYSNTDATSPWNSNGICKNCDPSACPVNIGTNISKPTPQSGANGCIANGGITTDNKNICNNGNWGPYTPPPAFNRAKCAPKSPDPCGGGADHGGPGKACSWDDTGCPEVNIPNCTGQGGPLKAQNACWISTSAADPCPDTSGDMYWTGQWRVDVLILGKKFCEYSSYKDQSARSPGALGDGT